MAVLALCPSPTPSMNNSLTSQYCDGIMEHAICVTVANLKPVSDFFCFLHHAPLHRSRSHYEFINDAQNTVQFTNFGLSCTAGVTAEVQLWMFHRQANTDTLLMSSDCYLCQIHAFVHYYMPQSETYKNVPPSLYGEFVQFFVLFIWCETW